MPILLKRYRCLGHGLKICIMFAYNPQIMICHFFSQNELSHFFDQRERILDRVYATPATVLCQFF